MGELQIVGKLIRLIKMAIKTVTYKVKFQHEILGDLQIHNIRRRAGVSAF